MNLLFVITTSQIAHVIILVFFSPFIRAKIKKVIEIKRDTFELGREVGKVSLSLFVLHFVRVS
jgi:hypothetical protein